MSPSPWDSLVNAIQLSLYGDDQVLSLIKAAF
jgi:hypothetical protein